MFFKKIIYAVFLMLNLLNSAFAGAFLDYVLAHMNKNPEVVFSYLNNLEKSKNNDVLIELASFYLENTPFYNLTKANEIFRCVAENNDPRGYKGLADSYLSGQGVPLNYTLAQIFYEKAAKLNYGPAQFNVGILYRDGQGSKKSFNKACYWLKKAASNHDFELNYAAADVAKKINCLGF